MEPADLYGLPLERFTEERNTLAKQLRQAGRRDEAESVAKLRKPSLAAWAVNQLVRTQRRELDALFRAGDALQTAQANLVSHRGERHALRRAVEDERAAVDQLTGRARGLLSSQGNELTPPKLEHVSETLHAAALDHEARARVRNGCLERELRHIGLGDLGGPGDAPKRTRSKERPARARQDQTARSEARKAEAEARRRMERAARELRTAEERRDRAAESLREAEEVLKRAQQDAAKGRREHQRASHRLDQSS